jgi:hypothetical protein
MKSCKSIGIVGTAKNTGKTTTLAYLLNNIFNKKICVTGIGYDGEEIDNITNLPKPRLLLSAGITAFTSQDCLKNTSAKIIIKEKTGFYSALGEIIKVEIVEPGLLVIAGPNKQSELELIINKNKNEHDLIFIDGSLNRLAPLSAVDEIIFTTGASRNTDPDILADEMNAIETIFGFPQKKADTIVHNKESLFDTEDFHLLKSELKPGSNSYRVNKMLGNKFLGSITNHLMMNKKVYLNLILSSPISLLLSGEPGNILSSIKSAKNLNIYFDKKIELKAVTINPFYPKIDGNIYKEAWIDKKELFKSFQAKLNVPVFDMKENPSGLLNVLDKRF